jgi:hypothetical protein
MKKQLVAALVLQVPREDPCEFCLCLDGELFCWWQDCPPCRGSVSSTACGKFCLRANCYVGVSGCTSRPTFQTTAMHVTPHTKLPVPPSVWQRRAPEVLRCAESYFLLQSITRQRTWRPRRHPRRLSPLPSAVVRPRRWQPVVTRWQRWHN